MTQNTQHNPWTTMWGEPRSTIRAIVQSHPRYGVFWLSAIYVLQNLFFYFNFWSWGFIASLSALVIPAIATSPILGLIWIYFYGWLLKLTGHWLGGRAPASHIRSALAWSRIPTSISLVMWFFLIVSNPDYVFIQYAGGLSAFFVLFITLILDTWSLVLLVQSLREVEHFTILRSLASIFLAALIYSLILFCVILLIRFIFQM